MLTLKQLALAETLAVDVKHDIVAHSSAIIAGANSTLGGVAPIDKSNYTVEIVKNSADGDHCNYVEEVSEVLAANMRQTFNQIGLYGKGITNAIVDAVAKCDAFTGDVRRSANDFLVSHFNLQFIRTDHPFFSSLLYPQRLPAVTMNFSSVGKDFLSKLRFTRWEDRKIIDWLGIDNQEINQLLMSPNINLPSALNGLAYPYSLPFVYDEKTNTIDFTQPRLNCAEEIFAQYIILSKMVSEDAPFEGLSGGSLEDYRTHISILHKAYTTALITLKKQMSGLASYPIRISELETPQVRDGYVLEGSKAFPIVRANLIVYYNKAGIDLCTAAKLNFTDVAMAYVYQKYVGLEPEAARTYLTNPTGAEDYNRKMINAVCDIIRSMSAVVCNKAIRQAIALFISEHEELLDITGKSPVEIGSFIDRLYKDDNWGERLIYQITDSKCTLADGVFKTNFPTMFLKSIGCIDAAAILTRTVSLGREQEVDKDKRENLHVAAIEHFADKLFTKD